MHSLITERVADTMRYALSVWSAKCKWTEMESWFFAAFKSKSFFWRRNNECNRCDWYACVSAATTQFWYRSLSLSHHRSYRRASWFNFVRSLSSFGLLFFFLSWYWRRVIVLIHIYLSSNVAVLGGESETRSENSSYHRLGSDFLIAKTV